MEPLAVLGLAGLLLVKEAGVPVPIPGDLLVLGAGVAAAGDPQRGVLALVAILVAGYVGGTVQFLLVRGTLRRAVLRFLTRVGVPEHRIEALAARLRRSGARGVAVARATPGIRIGAIAASAVAAVPPRAFAAGLVAGNTVFVGAHFALGFLVGPPARRALEGSGGLLVAVGALAALSLLGAVGWFVLRRRRRARGLPDGVVGETAPYGFATWADAACPACLAAGALRLRG